jgi:hypothetical protein
VRGTIKPERKCLYPGLIAASKTGQEFSSLTGGQSCLLQFLPSISISWLITSAHGQAFYFELARRMIRPLSFWD